MRIANGWDDYEILDASDGEKLERWGNVTLIRPDPQIIWKTPRDSKLWSSADAHYIRSNKGGGQWQYKKSIPNQWNINYNNLKFNIRPTNFKHTGLFPEQAVNWDLMQGLIKSANRPINVLNLFAYTGGATVACAEAGASVCHVDAAKGMVQWARDNANSSGLADKPIRWIVDDAMKFLGREIRRGNKYDGIVMDPPSYGRGPNKEVWKLEDEIFNFVVKCTELLSDDAKFMIINSYTAGISPSVMEYILAVTAKKKFGGTVSSDEIGLPVTETGMTLACGGTAIWKGNL